VGGDLAQERARGWREPPRLALLLAFASIPLGIYAEWCFARVGASPPTVIYDVVVGWAFAAAGAIASVRQPGNRTGLLMAAEGVTWFLNNLEGSGVGALVFLGGWLATLDEPVLAHLILASPGGRLTSRLERDLVLAGYALSLLAGLAYVSSAGIHQYDPYRCAGCRLSIALLPEHALAAVQVVSEALSTLQCAAVLALVVTRWARSTMLGRRALSPALSWLASGVFLLGAHSTAALQVQPTVRAVDLFVWTSDVLQIVLPAGFLLVALRMRMARAAVGELVLELGSDLTLSRIQSGLARALDDPSLEVGLWDEASGTYRDGADRPLALPGDGDWRTSTRIHLDDRLVAVVVHDRLLAGDPLLMRTIAAATRLGAERERLVSRLHDQLDEMRASRARIAEAADRERRRLERDLHDGAQQRFVLASMTLGSALRRLSVEPEVSEVQAALAEATGELQRGLQELRDLAHGMHPAVLSDHGLLAAAESLASRSPVPVLVAVTSERFPPRVEMTAYFVMSEALTNVARHAGASRAQVTAARQGDRLVVEIEDDGVGGASPERGSGLRGLSDRVEAAGGRLTVTSPEGAGTRVRAELPHLHVAAG
jgi:signal transduction histidine kinase